MAREQYMRQVDLLVRTLPHIARHEAFALKGGTAINLFYRDMPRLSVDIDLTYLPIEDRDTTLKGIDTTLGHIREDLLRNLRGASVQRIAGGGNIDTRILVRQGNAEIKVETSPVARGTVHPPERRRVTNGSSTAWAVEWILSRLQPGSSSGSVTDLTLSDRTASFEQTKVQSDDADTAILRSRFERLRDMMIARGARFPADPPDVVRAQMKSQSLPVAE